MPLLTRLKQLFTYIGVLRILLTLLVIIMVAFRPFAGGEISYSGWNVLPTLVVPAVVPIVFAVVLLDSLMSLVFMVDTIGAKRKRFKVILMMHIVSVALLLMAWVSYFMSIGE